MSKNALIRWGEGRLHVLHMYVSYIRQFFSPIPRMAEWVKQQAEREAEKEQKRLERLQRKLAEPRHCFTSPDYQQQCHEMAERLEDSVLKGEKEDSLVWSAGAPEASCSRLFHICAWTARKAQFFSFLGYRHLEIW